MEKYKKIKTTLKEHNIPFEKKHKKDDSIFSVFESDDYIMVYTRYMPFIKKDNPKSIFAELPIIYNTFYAYWSVFDKNENYIMSIPTTRGYTEPIFLDKKNFILLRSYGTNSSDYYHYKQLKNSYVACTFFNNIRVSNILKNNGVILTDNKLYDFKKEKFISIPFGFELLYQDNQFDNLFKLWKIDNYSAITTLLVNKLDDNELFCLLKQISYEEDGISCGYDIIAFMDKTGKIVSDLFYRKDNEIVSQKIDKPINFIFNDIEEDCIRKVKAIIANNKSRHIEKDVIKKLEL